MNELLKIDTSKAEHITRTTKVTGKGRVYFINKVLQEYGNQKN